jgi:hypothetical protein
MLAPGFHCIILVGMRAQKHESRAAMSRWSISPVSLQSQLMTTVNVRDSSTVSEGKHANSDEPPRGVLNTRRNGLVLEVQNPDT